MSAPHRPRRSNRSLCLRPHSHTPTTSAGGRHAGALRLAAFRRSNQELTTFNDFSAKRYQQVSRDFEGHTRMLVAMKADLDSIFRRIRTLQAKLSKQYPQAFAEVSQV